jgi:hypothetical protein
MTTELATIRSGKSKRASGAPAVRRQIDLLLRAEVKRLEKIEAAMSAMGLTEEANSVATVVADLEWQHDELRRPR